MIESYTSKGWVKWYNVDKGFGFVTSETDTRDILLHANVLEKFGRRSIVDNIPIAFEVQLCGRGLRVSSIHSIGQEITPEINIYKDSPPLTTVKNDASMPVRITRVKWFDDCKGFGFVNEFSSSEDILVHIDVLTKFGLSTLQVGEAIAVRVIDTERGEMACEILPWDRLPGGAAA